MKMFYIYTHTIMLSIHSSTQIKKREPNLIIYSEKAHAFKKISAFYFSQHLEKSISD